MSSPRIQWRDPSARRAHAARGRAPRAGFVEHRAGTARGAVSSLLALGLAAIVLLGGALAWIWFRSASSLERDAVSSTATSTPVQNSPPSSVVPSSSARPSSPPAPLPAQEPTPSFTTMPAPGPVRADVFHPDQKPRADGTFPPLPTPAYGGRVSVHVEALPKTLCNALDVGAATRRILYEVHETLLWQDWETYAWKPNLCTSFDVEDTLVLTGGRSADGKNIVFGKVTEADGGYRIAPLSKDNPLKGELRLGKAAVESVERGTVFTFHLRHDVTWHDGHTFDAEDVRFSWSLFQNKAVKCDEKRFQFQKILDVQVLDRFTLRALYAEQYFNAQTSIGDMPLVPRHLYDLRDPDNVVADPAFHAKKKTANPAWTPTDEDVGEYVNTNPHNIAWVGLGPYRVTEWGADFIEAERYPGYFAPARGGYLDTIRWRAIPSLQAGVQALLAGEIDFYNNLTTDDYFGPLTSEKAFTERCYKGWQPTSTYWFVGWNQHRALFQDVRVRQAFAHLFDFEEYRRTYYRGLAIQVTGHAPVVSPGYDRSIAPYPFDPRAAADLLRAAGWLRATADGLLEKGGVSFEFELFTQGGNPAAEKFAARFQENLASVGIRMRVKTMDLSALVALRKKRDFDAIALGWSPPLESDPEQVWHSRWAAPDLASSNWIGFADSQADALIERGQKEIDPAARAAIWRQLHARVYELQPYLFCFNPPRKFAMSKAIHGFQAVGIDPHYVIRRWYYAAGTSGTRPAAK